MSEVSQGDLTQKVPVFAKDEPAQLALMVNLMVEKISELIEKTGQLAENVGEASVCLLNTANEY